MLELESVRVNLDTSRAKALLAEIFTSALGARAIVDLSALDAGLVQPLPGQLWTEQGGTYAGIVRGDEGELHQLFVGPDVADFDGLAWGAYGKEEPDATSVWDGLANTRALIASKQDHPAAQAADQVSINGFSDWYVPAQVELSLCRATCRHLFKDAWYWGSTQYSADTAWMQSFAHGYQYLDNKDTTARVRLVRRLVIQ